MNKEWIKFADQLPEVGQSIWLGCTVEQSISCQYTPHLYLHPYTHWMPCDLPEKPLPDKAPEELALEEFIQGNPEVPTFPTRVWYAAIKWERERKK